MACCHKTAGKDSPGLTIWPSEFPNCRNQPKIESIGQVRKEQTSETEQRLSEKEVKQEEKGSET